MRMTLSKQLGLDSLSQTRLDRDMAKTLNSKELKRLLDGFESQGARIVRVNSGYRILAANGVGSATLHLTLSDRRGMLNFRQDCRKAGLEWPL